jgi:hypothetical protein
VRLSIERALLLFLEHGASFATFVIVRSLPRARCSRVVALSRGRKSFCLGGWRDHPSAARGGVCDFGGPWRSLCGRLSRTTLSSAPPRGLSPPCCFVSPSAGCESSRPPFVAARACFHRQRRRLSSTQSQKGEFSLPTRVSLSPCPSYPAVRRTTSNGAPRRHGDAA